MNSDILKKIGIVLAVAAVVFLMIVYFKGWLFDSDTKESKPPVPSAGETLAPGTGELDMTVLTSRKDGKKFWDMTADRLSVNQPEKKGHAQVVKVLFYNDREEVYITFEAPAAEVDLNTQSVFFQGKSVGKLSSGDTIEVNRLVWDGEKKKLFGYDGVKIFRDDYTLTSLEMWGDPAIHYVELMKNVKGVWKDPGALNVK